MNYISTRSPKCECCSGAYVIKQGLASDGGLFVPESIPAITLDEINELAGKSYVDRAVCVLGKFLTDYTAEELKSSAEAAYSPQKFSAPPAPISKVGERYFLELWHGPTCAFKDMALQIMPRLLSLALSKTGEEREALILVATSGDTGKAALEGYADVEGVSIKVFYPVHGVSNIQKKQMSSQQGSNVEVIAIDGNFDDAQNGVKSIFSSEDARRAVDAQGKFFSSANSINWGRLVPQIVYYVSAYCDLVSEGEIKLGDEIDVTVPTGNFGNILACYIAKMMGLPIGRMVCASNKNKILTDFISTGVYDRRRDFYTTVSPSMDILISSNLERLIYFLSDADTTRGYMESLAKDGAYTVSDDILAKVREHFEGGFCDEENTAATVKRYFEEYGYLLDTHTAVAACVADEYCANGTENKMLVVSTASPYKFAPAVLRALGIEPSDDDFVSLDMLASFTKMPVPAPLAALASKPDRFTKTVAKDDMQAAVIGD